MKTESKWRLYVAMLLVSAGCSRGTDAQKGAADKNQGPVIAFVAASTKDAVQEVAAAFTEAKQTKVVINADDSSKLAVQISEGAPAHLFLSANEKWAEFVKVKGFAHETK